MSIPIPRIRIKKDNFTAEELSLLKRYPCINSDDLNYFYFVSSNTMNVTKFLYLFHLWCIYDPDEREWIAWKSYLE